MSDKHIIESLSDVVKAGVASIDRDMKELERLQQTQSAVNDFAIASYRKAIATMKKKCLSMSTIYGIKYPTHIVMLSGGSRKSISVDRDNVTLETKSSVGEFVISPIDNFLNYSRTMPIASTSALLRVMSDDTVMLDSYAVLYDIHSNVFYTSAIGNGMYMNDLKIRVSNTSAIESACTAIHGFENAARFSTNLTKQQLMSVKNATMRFASTVTINSTNLALAYLASGKLDAVIDLDVMDEYSIASGMFLLKESGGIVSTLSGNDGSMDNILSSGTLVATNALIHDKILNAINIK